MKLCSLVSAALMIALTVLATRLASAAPVDPYTEGFTAGHANWVYGPGSGGGFANWESGGGPAGSSHISATMNTAGFAAGSGLLQFQGRINNNASNGEFVGSWLEGGIYRLSAWVRHNAPVSLPYFARITNTSGFPGVALVDGTLVAPNTWTKLEYDIDPSEIGSTVIPETVPPATDLITFNSVFSNVGRVQFGFNVPAELANSDTNYVYQLDQVSVVPEPAGIVLVLGGVGLAWTGRRRGV
jgi:hypothetical protein